MSLRNASRAPDSVRTFSAPTIAPSSEAKSRTRERPGIEGSKRYAAQKGLDRLPQGPLGRHVFGPHRESQVLARPSRPGGGRRPCRPSRLRIAYVPCARAASRVAHPDRRSVGGRSVVEMMEEEPREKVVVSGETMQIGKSRPPLPLTDLPEPEEVFRIKGRINTKQLFLYVLGPSMIALGVSIGSGEWLVGPRTVGGSSTGFIGIGWIVLVFGITLFGRKISRTLEIVNWFMVVFILLSVVIIAILVVPAAVWGNSFASLVIPAAPPPGTSATNLGALAGFTAFASGLNFVLINYYRDKGYGMGSRVGFIAGLVGGKQEEIRASGVTFRDTPQNRTLWRRWFRYLIYDQWGIFFVGALFGMMLPTMIVYQLAQTSGTKPNELTIPTFAADQLGVLFPNLAFLRPWALIAGFMILFSTQLVVFELLTRQFVDGAHAISPRFRKWT